MNGNRPVGRPQKRWKDEIQADARDLLQVRVRKRATTDREIWRQKLQATKVQLERHKKKNKKILHLIVTRQSSET